MAHLRLTHPTRGELVFRQAQQDEFQREAVANQTAEIGTDRKPLVHTETREETRTVRGLVSAPRRSRNDPDTNDWRQSLANYVTELESHVDEFQGDGYTLEDDVLDITRNCILESVQWELSPGQPYDVEFEAKAMVGRGTFEERPRDGPDATVDESLPTMLRVDGVECPGMRQYQLQRSIGTDPAAVFDRDSAENNDIITDEGVTRTVVFEGTHTGPRAERRTADDALDNLLATRENVALETLFPGYTIDGYVTGYNSDFEARFGTGKHTYRLEFTEGQRA